MNVYRLNKTIVHNLRYFSSLMRNNRTLLQKIRDQYTPKRQFFNKFYKSPTEADFKVKDNIPDEYKLIYRTNMEKYLIGCQAITVFIGTSILIITVVSEESKLPNFNKAASLENEFQVKHRKEDHLIYIFALSAFIVVLQLMMSRIPVRIYSYRRTKDYVFIFRGILPTTSKRATCKAAEVVKLKDSGILPWKDCRYKIVTNNEEKQLIMLEHLFRKPADYNILLGYQHESFDD